MKISEIFRKKTVVYSFEVFPPKKNSAVDTIYSTLDNLKGLNPDYISVTYGAGASDVNSLTSEIAGYIKNVLNIEPMAHLTCINSSKDTVIKVLDELKNKGVENILALRGDINPEIIPKYDFKYAKDLIEFIKSQGINAGVSGACYPEGHPQSDSLSDDIGFLKQKVAAGAETLITQLVFDNEKFYEFYESAQKAGINVPISVGIMPLTNKKQIERMVTMCAVSLPAKFVKVMARYENNPEALLDAGIAYAVDQIVDLAANGVKGIHIYTMNRYFVAEKITNATRSLL
ncbi:MAG: methylenetetrahydrofolate reductase [NAD(P)H] [Eubacterium sp.]|jgi:methylenetetrahydrofolate reductase (NADPH)|nr:methylenetetrahydrofolate reductase [NAD(P)H] [Eubacterium sp.]